VMAGLFLIFFCPFLSLCSWSLCHKLNQDLYEKLQYIQIQHFLLQIKLYLSIYQNSLLHFVQPDHLP